MFFTVSSSGGGETTHRFFFVLIFTADYFITLFKSSHSYDTVWELASESIYVSLHWLQLDCLVFAVICYASLYVQNLKFLGGALPFSFQAPLDVNGDGVVELVRFALWLHVYVDRCAHE